MMLSAAAAAADPARFCHLQLIRSLAAAAEAPTFDERYFKEKLSDLVRACKIMCQSLRENQLVAKDRFVLLSSLCKMMFDLMQGSRGGLFIFPCVWTLFLKLGMRVGQEVSCLSAISVEKVPTAAGFVRCGDADESNMVAKQTSLQEQIIQTSSGDGGGSGLQSNSAPTLPQLIETDPQHLRGLDRAARNNNQQGVSILMMNGGGGTDGVVIIDSGASVHASGNRFLFTQYGPVPEGKKLYAANGEEMPCAGYGSIRIPSLGLELRDVYHAPSMGDTTLLSVAELNELGYGVILRKDCRIIEDERTWPRKVVGEAHLVNGLFVLDYLKISLNRAPISDGTLTLMWRDVRMRWNRFTEFLFQRDDRLPR